MVEYEIKVGKTGDSRTVSIDSDEVLSFADVIARAGFDSIGTIKTNIGQVSPDDMVDVSKVTAVLVGSPKLDNGSERQVKVGKTGDSRTVTIGSDEVLSFADVINRAGFDSIGTIKTNIGQVSPDDMVTESVTAVLVGSPKLDNGR